MGSQRVGHGSDFHSLTHEGERRLLAGKSEQQTVVSLSVYFELGKKKFILAQKNNWEGTEGKDAIAGSF